MSDENRTIDFQEALETSEALEFIKSVEASELVIHNFEVKQRRTAVVVKCTPAEEDIGEDLREIADEHGFEQRMDAPSLQEFHKDL